MRRSALERVETGAWWALAAILLLAAGCKQDEPSAPREPVLLQQQRPLSDEEYRRAVVAWGQGKKAFEERASYLKARKLDPALFMPDLGWNDTVTSPFREFLAEKPSHVRVQQLRMHTQDFTGYSLYMFRRADLAGRPPKAVPVNEWDAGHRARIPDGSVRAFEQLARELPRKYLVKVPRTMGEVGWDVDGHVVNWDVLAYQESLAVLHRSGVLAWLEARVAAGEKIRILEIGSGYGGFAYFFTEIFPDAAYWMCDLPESLPVAAMYLSVTRKGSWKGIYPGCEGGCDGPGLFGLANYRFEEFSHKGRQVDLVINMISLSEMPEAQINYYGRKVAQLIGNGGVFFEQNYNLRAAGYNNAKEVLPRHFKASTDLGPSTNRGHGHLWANDPALLQRIRAGRP